MATNQTKTITRDAIRDELTSKARRRRDQFTRTAKAERLQPARRNDLIPEIAKELRRPQDLTVPTRRLRKRDPVQNQRLKSSIQGFGFVVPVLIEAGGAIIDGATRCEVAIELGLEQIPCLVVGHLSAEELRVLRIALNRLGETGGWEMDDLKADFAELRLVNAPLELSGFTFPEIDGLLLVDEELSAIDEPSLPPTHAVTRTGDLWRLGEHRIVCGDAREFATLSRLMGGELARLVLTDEPYNVRVSGHVTTGDHREFAMASGEMSAAEFLSFNDQWISAALEQLMDGGLLATFIDWRGIDTVQTAARAAGLELLNLVVWSKTNAGQGSLWRSQHELLPVFKKGAAAHVNNVQLGKFGRWRSNVWTYPGASSLGSDAREALAGHPTVKPVAMLEDALLDVTNAGDLVLDPFLGSGSTLLAAERAHRRCRGVEIDPLYVDLAIARWRRLTGIEAVHEETGEDFSVVALARQTDFEEE